METKQHSTKTPNGQEIKKNTLREMKMEMPTVQNLWSEAKLLREVYSNTSRNKKNIINNLIYYLKGLEKWRITKAQNKQKERINKN